MVRISGLWIDKLGVEIECGIDDTLPKSQKQVPGFSFEHDGSIRTDKSQSQKAEYVSNRIEYPDEIERLPGKVRQVYGNITEINASMGLHIHVSLNKDLYYYRLASLKFHDWFISRVKDSELWEKCPRLRKRVRNRDYHPYHSDRKYGFFCRPITDNSTIDTQLDSYGRKYRRITYMKHKYGTVEFRLFPAMESPEKVIDAVNLVTTSINSYLRQGLYTDNVSTIKEIDQLEVEKNLESTVSVEGVEQSDV
ncbi:amidoligase family protein [Haloarcula japonica]|uniref:amidoligase family protein n=1 Tax=Haloarcula japonica TaxID=29282 RepID=UPI0039F665D8